MEQQTNGGMIWESGNPKSDVIRKRIYDLIGDRITEPASNFLGTHQKCYFKNLTEDEEVKIKQIIDEMNQYP